MSAWRCFEWTDKNGSNSKHQWYFSEIPAGKTFCWIKFLKEFDVKIWIFLLNRLLKKCTSKYQFGRWQNKKTWFVINKRDSFFSSLKICEILKLARNADIMCIFISFGKSLFILVDVRLLIKKNPCTFVWSKRQLTFAFDAVFL